MQRSISDSDSSKSSSTDITEKITKWPYTHSTEDIQLNTETVKHKPLTAQQKQLNAEKKKVQRSLQTAEQKQIAVECRKMKRRLQTPEEKQLNLQIRKVKQTAEQRQLHAERQKRKRSLQTQEQKQSNLEKRKENRTLQTTEQKQLDAERQKRKRSLQTQEQRQKNTKMANAKKGEKWEDIETAIRNFQTAMQEGPSYVCTVCHRLMYKCSVKHIAADSLEKRYKKTARSLLTELFECHEKYGSFVCNTCDGALLKGKIPAQAKINGLQLDTVPEELKCLTSLERQLISTRIPFMKIVSLPRGRQCALHGPVVNVPAKFNKICTLLPRIPKSAALVRIKLKRQLKYKGHCMYQMVRPKVIKKALDWLQANNMLYKEVTENYTWEEEWKEQEEFLWQAMTTAPADEDTEQTPCEQPVTDADSSELERANEDRLQSTSTATSAHDCHYEEDQVALDRDTSTRGNPLDSCFHINNVESKTISIAPAEGETPLPIFLDEAFEEGCNPDKYPYGTGGLGANRKTRLTAKKYFNQRILDVDGRFARDVQYLHIAQYAVESKSIQDQIRIAFRKVKRRKINGKDITAGLLKNNEHMSQLIHSDQAFKFMRNIRGSPAYWQRVFYDVLAMVRQLGCPTWFVSLSAADMHWPELIRLIASERGRKLTDQDIKQLSWDEKCQILRENPVTAARQFNYRVDKFFSLFLKSTSNPIGKVTESFIRIEFQARGSPHAHALIWIENSPTIDIESDQEVCEFIDRYVTCCARPNQPDIEQEVPLQQHHHSSTCRRGSQNTCRFGYPQLPSQRTIITRPPENIEQLPEWLRLRASVVTAVHQEIVKLNLDNNTTKTLNEILEACEITEELYDKLLKIGTGSKVIMKRATADLWTNNYNPDILKSWHGNMDIQYITEVYACVMYIVSYACKAENSMSEMIREAVKENANDDFRTQMKKVAATFLNHQEISAQEAAYRLLSLYLKKMSRKVVFVDSNQKDNRVSLSKPYEEIESKEDDDKDLFFTSVHEKYSSRPKELEGMCLAEFATNYRSLSQQQVDDHLHDDEVEDEDFSTEPGSMIKLQDGRGFVCKRQQPAILRYRKFNVEKEEEKHFYSKLLLYLPWRNEERDLTNCSNAGKTYKDLYKEKISIITENEIQFNKCGTSIDNALDMLADSNNDDKWNELHPAVLQEAAECQQAGSTVECDIHQDDVQANANMLIAANASSSNETSYSVHHQPDEMNDSDYNALLNSLNLEQCSIVNSVKQWCQDTVNSISLNQAKPPPFYSFVSGPGGVGKSHVIKAVYETCRKLLKPVHVEDPEAPTVLLTAPTGAAAYNIGGLTLHSAFQLNTQHGYQSLSSERQQTLHNSLQHLHLVIIDEISMVGSQTLFDIHRRLKEIMNRSDYDESVFGGISVMAVGDLYQLQPVRQKYVFELPTDPYAQLYGCLWDKFVLHELTISMRQRDQQFADMLNRVRTATHAAQDLVVVSSRIAADNSSYRYPSEALHVFATNAMTDEYNSSKLRTLPEPHYTIVAADSKADQNTGQVTVKMPQKCSETGGLKEFLILAQGARVMLTNNLDVLDGLVNGARGEVADFRFDTDGSIQTIFVKFDNAKIGTKAAAKTNSGKLTPIKKIEAKFATGRRRGAEVARRQFPLQLAWACTIHKVQGITTDNIVVSFQGHFGPGQAYVALSRVRSLEGLYMTNFSSKKIISSHKVQKHMTELRARNHDRSTDNQDTYDTDQNGRVTTPKQTADKTKSLQHQTAEDKPKKNKKTGDKTGIQQQQNARHIDTFDCCEVQSIDDVFQTTLCARLNLMRLPHAQPGMSPSQATTASQLEQMIYTKTATHVSVHIEKISGDGNCLFRALSHALTGSQAQHDILRLYITSYMAEPEVVQKLQSLFSDEDRLTESHVKHIVSMQEVGEWGTEQEIAAAAHLFDCSIICYSKYSNTEFCIQHFPPHFINSTQCTWSCKHHTLYLINSSGAHYESAVVRTRHAEE